MLVLPAAAWAVVFLVVFAGRSLMRQAALVATTAVSGALLVFTVVLSHARALTFGWLTTCWAVLLLVLASWLRTRLRPGWLALRRSLRHRDWGLWEWLTAAVLGFFALGTLLSALLYPIMNSDSLAYHMPRVFFWFQNGSVAHYPTPEGRQLFSSPFAEYVILNLKILAGGTDALSNTVQWFAYVFAALTASLVAMRLGAARRGQQTAAIVAAATPMALLQASTTQTTCVCAFWSLAAVYWMVSYTRRSPDGRRETVGWILLISTSLALAVLTKPQAYIAVAPFLLWLAIVAVRRDGLGRATALASAVIVVVIALNGGWYAENARVLAGGHNRHERAGRQLEDPIRDRDVSAVVTNALKSRP